MIQIPLTKIGFFNPGRLTDEEIEQFFITRVPFFEYLFEKIASERPKSIPQHYLVIGQRGMGKTSLLMRIAAELRKAPHNKKFIALSFPEEQYNVDRLSKFWLNCLDALADALDKENNKTELDLLDAEIAAITKQNDVEAKTIYELFCKWTTKIKRRPVLLVDNLNLIFAKITTEEQHQLRGTLISNDAPILVGASASTIEETVDYGAPFYDAFQISYLKKLSFEESLEVLLNLAKITGNENFENNVYKQRGRLEALYDLTGGTPRTLAILFPLIQDGFSEKIQTDLDALLDVITPLYKARFEELAPQLQVVMDAVALHWDPINLEQLRTSTQLPSSILSPQLKRLTEVGWLQKLDAYKAKGGAYELSERFFNVWYLMRRSSRRQKRELYCLTKFLESFYGNDLYDIAKNRITCKSESINHIALDLALAEAVNDRLISEKLKVKSYNALFFLSENDNNILKNFTIPKEVIDKKVVQLAEKVKENYENKNYVECESILMKILSFDDGNLYATKGLGAIYQAHLHKYIEAEKYFSKAITIDENDLESWIQLGYLYIYEIKNFTKAETAFKNVVRLDKKNIDAWNELAELYSNELKNFESGVNAYKKSLELDETNFENWIRLGIIYNLNLNDYQKAEEAFKSAIKINSKKEEAWYSLGLLYMANLNRYKDAENSFLKSLALNDEFENTWFALGFLYQNYLLDFSKSEKCYQKATELDSEYLQAWLGLGFVYQNNLNRINDAEVAFKKAIELDEKSPIIWGSLGELYKTKMGRFDDAETCLKKAIGFAKEVNHMYWNLLGNLYQDNLKNYLEAEIAYKSAIEIDKNYACAKYNLVFLLRDKLNKSEEAKEIFSSMQIANVFRDSHYLNEALFALHDKNIGIAELSLKKALEEIGENLPTNTEDDWYRSTAAIIKLGYGANLLNLLAKNGYDTILRPFYVAIQFLTNKEEPLFFNSIAAEVREPAKKIVEILKNHID
jgi:tetratricopeptide (TPR) repeat protein